MWGNILLKFIILNKYVEIYLKYWKNIKVCLWVYESCYYNIICIYK